MSADLRGRIVAGVPAVVFAIFIVIQGGWWFAAGALLLGLACLHELFELFADARPARLAGFLALIGLVVAAMEGDFMHIALVLVCLFPVLFLLTVAGPSAEGGTFGMAVVVLGVTWIGLAIAHAVLLRELPHGGGIMAAVLFGTFVGDTGAYFGGRAFGRRRMAPRISPNKTLEGLACGILTAVLTVWIVNLYQDWIDTAEALVLGAAVALAAPLGDLFESFIKRDAGTKDTGRLFGAHGGALDRLDAVLFSLVVGYYVWRALL
jgi:phosphatidate cytidylyltransferase